MLAVKRISLLVGNRPVWRDGVAKTIDSSRFQIMGTDLNAETIESPDVDVILPFNFDEYELIGASAYAQKKSAIPSADLVKLADDKLAFNKWLASTEHSLCLPTPLDGVRTLTFPLIWKKRTDECGVNSHIFKTVLDFESADVDLQNDEYLLQAYIPGDEEFVSHTISFGGVIVYCETNRQIFASPFFVKGKEGPLIIDNLGPVMPPEIGSILRLMNYTGCACFNYKMLDGVPKIFEMNPRIGGSFLRVTTEYIEGYLAALAYAAAPVGSKKECPVPWVPLNSDNIQQALSAQSCLRRSARPILRELRRARRWSLGLAFSKIQNSRPTIHNSTR